MRPLRPERKSDASETSQITDSENVPPAACTVACTSEAENVNGDAGSTPAEPSTASPQTDATGTLAALAAALTGLDPKARGALAAMLLGAMTPKPIAPPSNKRT